MSNFYMEPMWETYADRLEVVRTFFPLPGSYESEEMIFIRRTKSMRTAVKGVGKGKVWQSESWEELIEPLGKMRTAGRK